MRRRLLLFEVDEVLRRLERRHAAAPSEEHREHYIHALHRAGQTEKAHRVEAVHHARQYRQAHQDHEKLTDDMTARRETWNAGKLFDILSNRDHHEWHLRRLGKELKQPPGYLLPRHPRESREEHASHLARVSGALTGSSHPDLDDKTKGIAVFGRVENARNFANALKRHYSGTGTLIRSRRSYSHEVRFRFPKDDQ